MKKRSIFLLCLVGYLIFIFLIFTEPLNFNPVFACVLSFLFFCFFYLFLTGSYRPMVSVFDKIFPTTGLDNYNRFSERLEFYTSYLIVFGSGWLSHNYWTTLSENKDGNFVWTVYFLILAIITVIKQKNEYI